MNKFPHHASVQHTTRRVKIAGHYVMGMWHLHKTWCEAYVGCRGEHWDYTNSGHFYFEKEQDRTLFLLRWA